MWKPDFSIINIVQKIRIFCTILLHGVARLVETVLEPNLWRISGYRVEPIKIGLIRNVQRCMLYRDCFRISWWITSNASVMNIYRIWRAPNHWSITTEMKDTTLILCDWQYIYNMQTRGFWLKGYEMGFTNTTYKYKIFYTFCHIVNFEFTGRV